MKQLLFLLLLLPGLALAQKQAPPSVIIGQPALDARQDSTIAANRAAIPTSASAIGAVSSTMYASDKSAQGVLDGAQSASIASNASAIAAKADKPPTIATFLLAKAAVTPGVPKSFLITNNELYGAPTNSNYDGTNWWHSPALVQNN